MAQITLYCEETPGLKLGPGIATVVRTTHEEGKDTPPLAAGGVIVFADGFASFDDKTYPDWAKWAYASGSPTIRVVDDKSGDATTSAGAVACPVCGRLLKSNFGLNSHLRVHAPKP